MKIDINRKNITNIFITIIICANPINWIFQIDQGLSFIIIFSFIIIALLNIKHLSKNINLKVLIFLLYLYAFFILSLIRSNFNQQSVLYFFQFTILGVLPIFVSTIPIKYKNIYPFIIFIGVLFIPFSFNFDYSHFYSIYLDDTWGFLMGVSYGLLRFAVAGIILLLLYPKQKGFLKLLCFFVICAVLFFLFQFGSRGAILSFLLLFILLYVFKNNNQFNIKSISKLIYIGIIIIIVAIIFFYHIYPNFIEEGIKFTFIERTLLLIEENNLSSGRDLIARDTLNLILKRPLFGYGIGSFDNYSGLYPHNLFLSFLYEGGILLCMPFIYLFIKSIEVIFSSKFEKDYRVFIIFLFFSSVIELLFSSQPWISQMFWLYIGSIILSNKHKINFTNEYSINSQSRFR